MDVHLKSQDDPHSAITITHPRYFRPVAISCEECSTIMGEQVGELTCYIDDELYVAMAYFDYDGSFRLLFVDITASGPADRSKWSAQKKRIPWRFEKGPELRLQQYPELGAVQIFYKDQWYVAYANAVTKKKSSQKFKEAVEVKLRDVLRFACIGWDQYGEKEKEIVRNWAV